jgi:sensor domain CHASE-containing protein
MIAALTALLAMTLLGMGTAIQRMSRDRSDRKPE